MSCPAGTYSKAQSANCLGSPSGTYSDQAGEASCWKRCIDAVYTRELIGNYAGTQGASTWGACISSSVNETAGSCSSGEMSKFEKCVSDLPGTSNPCMMLTVRAECAPQCWCTREHKTDLETVLKMIDGTHSDGCSGVVCGFSISAIDWVFVIYCIVFDVLTWQFLWSLQRDRGCCDVLLQCRGRSFTVYMLGLISSVGCYVGKLYPTMYFCKTSTCAKVTHNAILKLLNVPFDIVATVTLGRIEAREEHSYFER